MHPITILFHSSSSDVIDSCAGMDAPDISVETLMLKALIDGEMLFTAFVTLTSGVAINLFSQWLYDKIKDKPNEKIMINGNQIFAEKVNVIQISQIIQSPPNGGEDKSKANDLV
jgi:hypothetical protein